MTNTIHDDVSILRIRIPVIRDEEEDEEHTVTPYQDYEYEYDYDYDPFDDLDNHYACLEYFELLRQARRQLHSEYNRDPFDIFSPIPFVEDYN